MMKREINPKILHRGFTILEMIVVLAIIAAIAGLVGPRLFKEADKAKVKTAKTQIKMIKGALQVMRLEINRFPTNQEGLQLLVSRPNGGRIAEVWDGPYLEDGLPNDPWNNPYIYLNEPSETQPFQLYSLGADGKRGGSGYNEDIGYLPVE